MHPKIGQSGYFNTTFIIYVLKIGKLRLLEKSKCYTKYVHKKVKNFNDIYRNYSILVYSSVNLWPHNFIGFKKKALEPI